MQRYRSRTPLVTIGAVLLLTCAAFDGRALAKPIQRLGLRFNNATEQINRWVFGSFRSFAEWRTAGVKTVLRTDFRGRRRPRAVGYRRSVTDNHGRESVVLVDDKKTVTIHHSSRANGKTIRQTTRLVGNKPVAQERWEIEPDGAFTYRHRDKTTNTLTVEKKPAQYKRGSMWRIPPPRIKF